MEKLNKNVIKLADGIEEMIKDLDGASHKNEVFES